MMAQSQNISGTVADASGGLIPAAAVKIMDAAKGGIAREVNTDDAGRFQAINIQPGKYLISVEKTGFKKAELTVTLDVNSKMDVGQIKLEVGNVTEAVSVDAESTPLVTSNTMEKAFLVDRTQIAELPMNGRNWVSLMSTVPGMSSSARNDFDVNFNDVSQFHGLGGRGSQNNFYLDGSPNLDVGDNQSQYTQPSIDSIAEFRVLQSSFNAEYGRNEGMAVAVQTKSGAARFHGTAYEYLRNDAFDAKCVLCNTLSPKLRYNQFGGNFSGWAPMPKLSTVQNKKLFFFYNREMTRRVLPSSAYADIPNAKIMSGDFSPFLLNTNMTYAPQFKTGTVFQPGTIKRDGAGNIIDGATLRQQRGAAIAVAAAERQHAEDLYRNPRLCQPSGRTESGLRPLLLQQSQPSVEESGPAARGLRDLEQDEHVLPLGERLPERAERERNLDRRAFPDPTANAAEAGQFLVVEPGEYVHAVAGGRDHPVL